MKRSRKRLVLLILAFGFAIILAGPLLIPMPPLIDTLPSRALADADSLFIDVGSQEIHVKKMGGGEPFFLLLHGFASSLYTWHATMEPLSQIGTVIAYDRTGFGLSERPLTWIGSNPYGIEAQVDLAVKLLDHFGVQQAILVGSSAGGTISMQVARDHPERVAALILVDPAVYNGGGAPEWLKPILATPQLRRIGPLITRQILNRGPELLDLAWHNPGLIPPDVLEQYQKPFRVENWDKALWEFTLASRPSKLSEQLNDFTLPILVVTGDDDRIVPIKDSIRLADELPNATLEVIAEAGHLPHEEQPRAFMEALNRFLSYYQP